MDARGLSMEMILPVCERSTLVELSELIVKQIRRLYSKILSKAKHNIVKKEKPRGDDFNESFSLGFRYLYLCCCRNQMLHSVLTNILLRGFRCD